jgi:hypothetical protein
MKKFAVSVMASRYALKESDPSIKDVFGLFTDARDPETGELALSPLDVRRNSSNFIIAGTYFSFPPNFRKKTNI